MVVNGIFPALNGAEFQAMCLGKPLVTAVCPIAVDAVIIVERGVEGRLFAVQLIPPVLSITVIHSELGGLLCSFTVSLYDIQQYFFAEYGVIVYIKSQFHTEVSNFL